MDRNIKVYKFFLKKYMRVRFKHDISLLYISFTYSKLHNFLRRSQPIKPDKVLDSNSPSYFLSI